MTDYTTTQIIADIRKLIGAGTNTTMTSNENLVRYLNLELTGRIIPKIMREQEEHFVEYVDVPLTVGTSRYAVPTNAIGAKLKAIHLLSHDGTQSTEVKRTSLSVVGNMSRGDVYGFYMTGNYWNLVPTPSSAETMRVYYYRRPNTLVTPGEGGIVESINVGANTFDLVGQVPSGWAIGSELEAVQGTPNFESITTMTISNISSTTVTVDDVSDLSVGDTLTLSGFALVPQLPAELHPILTNWAAVRALKAKKDFDGAKMLEDTCKQMEEEIYPLITPRVDDTPETVTNVGGIFDYTSY